MEPVMTETLYSALPPVPETLTIAGEVLDISPLKVGELPRFARAVQPFADKLSAQPQWMSLLADDGDALIAALAIASRRPPQWVAELALDEAITLAQAVFEANADFFIRRVMPLIMGLSEQISTSVNARITATLPAKRSGVMPSPDSCMVDTAIPTS